MKIVILSEHSPPEIDGVGDYTYLLGKHIASIENNVSIVTFASKVMENYIIPIYKINVRPGEFFHHKMVSLLKIIKPDIFHYQVTVSLSKTPQFIYSSFILPYLLKKYLPNIKIVYTFHQYPSQFIESLQENETLISFGISLIKHFHSYFLNKIYNFLVTKYIDYVIVADPYYEKFINKKSKIKFIPIPSNIPSVEITPFEREQIRKRYGLSEKDLVIGYFGKIFQEKGFEKNIFLLKNIPNGKLLYIGKLSGNPIWIERIKSLIKKIGLTSRFIETGFLSADNVARCLNSVDVYVTLFSKGVSTKNTSFLAAVSQGIFVITTSKNKSGYYPDENVFYVSPKYDFTEVISAIKKYAGRKIKPNLNLWPQWDVIANEHIKLYHALVDKK